MIDRRAFLGTLGLLAAPLAAEAQPVGKTYRIGALIAGNAPAGWTPRGPGPDWRPPTPTPPPWSFLQGFRDLGYVQNRDFVMEWRYAEGHPDRLPELAAELVRAQVDVIVTHGTPATLALKQATKTIPIVFATIGHPVEKGIVASRARPGGNITGLAFQVGLSKYYQLLKEVAPTTDRVVVLYDPHSDPPVVDEWVRQARAMNMEWQAVALRGDVAQAFAAFGRGTNGLVLSGAGPLQRSADQICKLALQRRLPTAAFFATRFPEAGCLMSYGENLDDMWRRAAAFVDKILKGANPADLPVEQPTKFELVINLKAAKALGLTIPPSLLLRADQVIE